MPEITLFKDKIILILTSKSDFTSDLVIPKFHKNKIPFIRINTEDFIKFVKLNYLVNNRTSFFEFKDKKIYFDHIKSIWYRRPAIPQDLRLKKELYYNYYQIESNAIIENIFENINCFWVNHPIYIKHAEQKVYQLQNAENNGLNIPHSIITNIPEEILTFSKKYKKIIIKPLKQGEFIMNNNNYSLFTEIVDEIKVRYIKYLKYMPCFFQEYIKKEADIRVNIFGENFFTYRIYPKYKDEKIIDWRKIKRENLNYEKIDLPETIKKACIKIMKDLKLNFSIFEFVLSRDGKYFFIEINPNGEWAWIEKITQDKMSDALISLLN